MDDRILLLVVGALIGLSLWAVKGYINSRTGKIKFKEQYMTVGEIEEMCDKNHKQVRIRFEDQIIHLRETIDAKLEQGEKEFERLRIDMKEIHDLLRDLPKEVAKEVKG